MPFRHTPCMMSPTHGTPAAAPDESPESDLDRAAEWRTIAARILHAVDQVRFSDEDPHSRERATVAGIQSQTLLAETNTAALPDVAQDVLFRGVFDATDGCDTGSTELIATGLDRAMPGTGDLLIFVAVDGSHVVGAEGDIDDYGIETRSEVARAQALDRWTTRHHNGVLNAPAYLASTLLILASGACGLSDSMEDEDLLDFWAGEDYLGWPTRPTNWDT